MSSVTQTPERSTRLPAAMAVVAAVLLTISLISPAAAAPPSNPNQSAASWLGAQVNTDGALEGFTPGVADYGTTLQGIIGLAAAGAEGPTAQRMLDAVNGDIDTAVAPLGDATPADCHCPSWPTSPSARIRPTLAGPTWSHASRPPSE